MVDHFTPPLKKVVLQSKKRACGYRKIDKWIARHMGIVLIILSFSSETILYLKDLQIMTVQCYIRFHYIRNKKQNCKFMPRALHITVLQSSNNRNIIYTVTLGK